MVYNVIPSPCDRSRPIGGGTRGPDAVTRTYTRLRYFKTDARTDDDAAGDLL